jgi:amidase
LTGFQWGETSNPLWGLTTYPENPLFTPGGSSGGEAALLAMFGSVCGWGTDIGGSIRIPSSICGIFGLKPTSSRFPYAGVPVSHEGQSHVPSSIGPMTTSLSSIVAVTKACLEAKPWTLDPAVSPIPWREEMYQEVQSRPLKIGVIFDDGTVRPHPEIEEAVRKAASLFEQAGHQVVPWDTSEHMSCIDIMDQFYRVDGGEDIRQEVAVAGEPLIPVISLLVESSKPISVYKYWRINQQKVVAQQAYNDKWNASINLGSDGVKLVDVIISPVLPHTAVPHNSCRWVGYTKIWNFLDYSALSFPFTVFASGPNQSSSSQHYSGGYVPRNSSDEFNHGTYNPALMQGLPIGVQIIGRRFEEEKVLGVATVLQNLLHQGRNLDVDA